VRHECLTIFVLSIPGWIVEHKTLVRPVRAFTFIWHDCMGWFCRCVERLMSRWLIVGATSRGVPPLRQVTQQ
jgi:hypothetical protein